MKTKKLFTILLALASTALLSAAPSDGSNENDSQKKSGQKGKRPNPGKMFKKLDANGDEMLSRDEISEAKAKRSKRMSKAFDEIDTNSDDLLSKDELKAFREKKRQQKKEKNDSNSQ